MDTKVIGNGSFGVVFQAKLCETGELVAIKKVLQDKRFKVRQQSCNVWVFFIMYSIGGSSSRMTLKKRGKVRKSLLG